MALLRAALGQVAGTDHLLHHQSAVGTGGVQRTQAVNDRDLLSSNKRQHPLGHLAALFKGVERIFRVPNFVDRAAFTIADLQLCILQHQLLQARPFMVVDCAAHPENPQIGIFQQANGKPVQDWVREFGNQNGFSGHEIREAATPAIRESSPYLWPCGEWLLETVQDRES